eukprot:2813487-Amphidinium_carterae.3
MTHCRIATSSPITVRSANSLEAFTSCASRMWVWDDELLRTLPNGQTSSTLVCACTQHTRLHELNPRSHGLLPISTSEGSKICNDARCYQHISGDVLNSLAYAWSSPSVCLASRCPTPSGL